MEGYKEIAIDSLKFTQVNGQVFRPIGIIHKRNVMEYNVRKYLGETLPVKAIEVASLLPIKGAK